MSVITWDASTQRIKVGAHKMSGKPLSVAFDANYKAPIDPDRQDFLSRLLHSLYPTSAVTIGGAPWDYTQTDQPKLHNGTTFGHYKVHIDEKPHIVCVNREIDETAIRLSAIVFDMYKAEGINTIGPVMLPNDNYVGQFEGYTYNLEETAPPTSLPLSDQKAKLAGKQRDLGIMVGRMLNTGKKLAPETQAELKAFSDNTSMRCYKAGIEVLSLNKTEFERLASLAGQHQAASKVKNLRETLAQVVNNAKERTQRLIDNPNRLSTSFNMIDKGVHIDPNGQLYFSSYDAISRGYVPMMTQNATHDAAFCILRIITNTKLYETGTAEEIEEGLKAFIEGYNETTGLALSVSEAIQAAKTLLSTQTAFGFGYNVLSKESNQNSDNSTEDDFVAHLVTNAIPVQQRLEALGLG